MINNKLIAMDRLPVFFEQRLVVTNGCFDIIHSGHVSYLSRARELGDKLLVGLNSDESIRALKGDGRPINSAEDRALVLSAFSFVDYICIFEEKKATNFLKAARPDVYVKAGDYSLETLDQSEKCILDLCGSHIKFIPFEKGKSTTKILERLKNEKDER